MKDNVRLKTKNTVDISDIPEEFQADVVKYLVTMKDRVAHHRVKKDQLVILYEEEVLHEVFINNYILTVSQLFVRSDERENEMNGCSFQWNKKHTIMTANISSRIFWESFSNEDGDGFCDTVENFLAETSQDVLA